MNTRPACLTAFLTSYACLKAECPLTRTARLAVKSRGALQNTTSPPTPTPIPSFNEDEGMTTNFGRISASLTEELREQVLGPI